MKNAAALADQLIKNGFRLVSGGTDNHLMLVDVYEKGITGKDAEKLLDSAHITVNKNTIPNETLSPFIASGIRVGTPAVTSRGFGEAQCRQVADLIAELLLAEDKEAAVQSVSAKVAALCEQFPIYE